MSSAQGFESLPSQRLNATSLRKSGILISATSNEDNLRNPAVSRTHLLNKMTEPLKKIHTLKSAPERHLDHTLRRTRDAAEFSLREAMTRSEIEKVHLRLLLLHLLPWRGYRCRCC